MNRGWRVKNWDRPLGRGVVTSDVGDLDFDASAALVPDFVVGEAVELELARGDGGYRVVRVWPDDPRFATVPRPPPGAAPALDADVEVNAASALTTADGLLDYRVASLGDDLVIEGDNDHFAYGARVVLTLRGVKYVELPRVWDGKSLRLASATERDYLSTRCEVTDRTIAVRVVDEARRIYFAVCEGISCTRPVDASR